MHAPDDLIPRRILGGVLMGRRPAILLVAPDGRVVEATGELAVYGLDRLRPGDSAPDAAPYLEGMFPAPDEPIRLESLAPVDGVYCDVHVVASGDGRTWVILLDCTESTETRRALQQRGNDLALLREKLERQNTELADARRRSDSLLDQVLPPQVAARLRVEDRAVVADRLRSDDRSIVDTFAATTFAFAEVTGFARQTAALPPTEQVAKLRAIFAEFDATAKGLGVTPIKTQGEVYIAAAGLPELAPDHADRVAQFALLVRHAVLGIDSGTEHPFSVRVGVASGPAVAGVIGAGRLAYDAWGQTVTTAEALQRSAPRGGIQVDEATRDALAGEFRFEERGAYYVKGGGELITYLLTGRLEGG